MKLIYAIVRSDDDARVIDGLNLHGLVVTKLATTGGFLKSGNTTLMIGVEEDRVQEVINIIKDEVGPRQRMIVNSVPMIGMGSAGTLPSTVDVGGATIFVTDVVHFERI